jgi:hypothetical protein
MSPSALSLPSENVAKNTVLPTPTTKLSEKQPFVTSPLCNPIDVLRDVRAYEHDRQRVKKATDLAKMREMKSRNTFERRNRWGPWGDKPKSVVRTGKISWFWGKEAAESEPEKIEQLEADSPLTLVAPKPSEVKLTDLVTPQKPRKTKGGDFEVIPAPRAVIVLDDFSVNDMDVDEPWEHVSGGEYEKRTSFSYAQIVSAVAAK